MKRLVVGVAALVLAGTPLGAGASPERYPPFKLVGSGEMYIRLGDGDHHRGLYVVSTRAAASRLGGLVKPEDRARLRRVNFRRSIVAGAFVDYPFPGYCVKNPLLRELQSIRGRHNAAVSVERYSGCVGTADIIATHLYSLATFPRRGVPRVPRPGQLSVWVLPPS